MREFSFFFPEKCLRYFDKKFSGEYAERDIKVTSMELPQMFRKMMGADDMDRFEFLQLIKRFVIIYLNMTGQEACRYFNMVNGQNTVNYKFQGPVPVVNCWYHLWSYAQVYKKCNTYAQRRPDFWTNENWVLNQNSREFRTFIGNFINHDLIHMPEKKIMPDGTVKTIMKIE